MPHNAAGKLPAAVLAKRLTLPETLLTRHAYPTAAKPLVSFTRLLGGSLPILDTAIHRQAAFPF